MASKTPVYEAITRTGVGSAYAVRIWTTLPSLEALRRFDRERLHNLARSLGQDQHVLAETVVAAYLALGDTSGVEVVDARGAGVVAYAEWP